MKKILELVTNNEVTDIRNSLDEIFFDRQDAILLDIIQNDAEYKPYRERLSKALADLINVIPGRVRSEVFREYESANTEEIGYCLLAIYKQAFKDGMVFAQQIGGIVND